MTAIEALKQINAIFSEYVAIAKDKNGSVYVYDTFEIMKDDIIGDSWNFIGVSSDCKKVSETFASKIEWNSNDWTKCIATLNDIENEMQGESKV